MKTLGIDLASPAASTAACTVDWSGGRATVERLILGVDDDAILELTGEADVIGIDAPFGWPDAFVAMLDPQCPVQPWTTSRRDELRLRATDREVHRITNRWPLSVSSDRIGVVAMRCDGILRRLGVTDRGGHARIVEVYPAAALAIWGLPCRGYKGRKNESALADAAEALLALVPALDVTADQRQHLRTSDHAFDALVSSLVARAGALDLVEPIPQDHRARARREGWIRLPVPSALAELARPAAQAS